MSKFEKFIQEALDAVDHPEKHPELPEEIIHERNRKEAEKKAAKNPPENPDWVKRLEKRQDEDEREF